MRKNTHLMPQDACVHLASFWNRKGLVSAGMKRSCPERIKPSRASCLYDNNILTTATVWSILLCCFYYLFFDLKSFFPLILCMDDEINNNGPAITPPAIRHRARRMWMYGEYHRLVWDVWLSGWKKCWWYHQRFLKSWEIHKSALSSRTKKRQSAWKKKRCWVLLFSSVPLPAAAETLSSLRTIEKRHWRSEKMPGGRAGRYGLKIILQYFWALSRYTRYISIFKCPKSTSLNARAGRQNWTLQMFLTKYPLWCDINVGMTIGIYFKKQSKKQTKKIQFWSIIIINVDIQTKWAKASIKKTELISWEITLLLCRLKNRKKHHFHFTT